MQKNLTNDNCHAKSHPRVCFIRLIKFSMIAIYFIDYYCQTDGEHVAGNQGQADGNPKTIKGFIAGKSRRHGTDFSDKTGETSSDVDLNTQD